MASDYDPAQSPTVSARDAARDNEDTQMVLRLVERLGSLLDQSELYYRMPRVIGESGHWAGVWLFTRESANSYALRGQWDGTSQPIAQVLVNDVQLRELLAHSVLPGIFLDREGRSALATLLHIERGVTVVVARNPNTGVPSTNASHSQDEPADFVLVLALSARTTPERAQRITRTILPVIASTLLVAARYERANQTLRQMQEQTEMLQRLDREISEHIQLDTVCAMVMDWAMRYTRATAGAVLLLDDELAHSTERHFRLVKQHGYLMSMSERDDALARTLNAPDSPPMQAARTATTQRRGDIGNKAGSSRKVRTGWERAAQMPAHLSVPIRRDNRTIGVIVVESAVETFTDEQIAFVERLAARAAVAIEHARLYTQTALEREKLQTILVDTADIVLAVDESDRIMFVSQSAVARLGLESSGAVLGLSFEVALANTPLLKAFVFARTSNSRVMQEVRLPIREDEIPPGEREEGTFNTYYAHFSRRQGLGWIIVMHDITPLKAVDQAKTELLSNVTHDLKTPLLSITSYVSLLQRAYPQVFSEDNAGRYVHGVMRSVDTMRGLIEDLVNFAEMEQGVRLQIERFDLREVLGESVALQMPIASLREVTVHPPDMPPDLPLIEGDPVRLAQVFSNLISNAIKYTPSGGEVRVFAARHGENVVITVRDTGIGISPEDQARVFDRFQRVRRDETRQIEGTGLGLAIVRRLVEVHYGQIGLESKIGEGSTFTIHLPVDQPEQPQRS